DIEADVHGGLTFGHPDVPCDKGQPDDGYWIGFDCAHAGDAPDPSLPLSPEHERAMATIANSPLGATARFRDVVRTQEYVEAECRKLCEQAQAAAVTRVVFEGDLAYTAEDGGHALIAEAHQVSPTTPD